MPASDLLFSDDHYRVDLFRADQPASRLLFTFTEFGNRTLDGPGFAGKFAIESGFHLVAIKANVDDWYASFPARAFETIEVGLERFGVSPGWRGCFGSSMGGYASLRFAKALRANVALAYSPQFDIGRDWDRRWARHAPRDSTFRTLRLEDVDPNCRYVLAFDPWDADGQHAREFAAVIPSAALELLRIPYAGHPVGYYLKATGRLKEFPRAAFTSREDGLEVLRSGRPGRTRFGDYFFNVAGHCLKRGKLPAARWAIGQARLAKPWHSEVLIRSAQIEERSKNLPSAAAWAALAVTLSPRHPHFAATLARILHEGGRHSEALHHIGVAMALTDRQAQFEPQRRAIMAAMESGPGRKAQ